MAPFKKRGSEAMRENLHGDEVASQEIGHEDFKLAYNRGDFVGLGKRVLSVNEPASEVVAVGKKTKGLTCWRIGDS